MSTQIIHQAEQLAEKIKHYLITACDKVLEEANAYEFYEALSYALREEIMCNWAACRRTVSQKAQRMLFYLSMEYLPGRILGNNITNLQANELVAAAVKILGRTLPEIAACEEDPGLGNGGLGRLASCFLDSLATLQYPAKGYGLRYQYGVFDQEIWDGVQVERPDPWLLLENPWQARRDTFAQTVRFRGQCIKTANIFGDEVYDLEDFEEVRALPYDIPIVGYCRTPDFSVLTLRLWTTKESPRNFQLQCYNAGQLDQAAENTTLTDVLYPADYHAMGKRVRLKQEFLLVSASLQDIVHGYKALNYGLKDFGDLVRIQINDTHPALVVAELMRLLTKLDGLPWQAAWETTQAVVGFTNHTILREALEEWDQELFRILLPRQYLIIEQLNQNLCNQVRTKWPTDEDKVRRMSIIESGKVRMAHLAIFGSHKVNGVAALHSEILKKIVFKDFCDLFPERFDNVTNGVTQRRWLLHSNPELAQFLTDKLGGDYWITEFDQVQGLSEVAADPNAQKEFLAIKRRNKERFIHFVRTQNRLHDQHGRPLRNIPFIDADSLFDVQIKRFHEYKRQLLNALHAIMVYQELCENPQARSIKRTLIFGGKAAPSYRMSKNIIRLIYLMAAKINGDTTIGDKLKIIIVENYNVSRAQEIIPAAELSEQISTAGLEASGTGNMKLAMNGALTIGTDDGANVEMRQAVGDHFWPFLFGASAPEIEQMKYAKKYNSWMVYSEYPKIRKAVDTLRDRTFTRNEEEQQALQELHTGLLEGTFDTLADPYFLLHDLPSYYETQKKVEELYLNPGKWAEYAMQNIAGMGRFSSDRSIKDYAEKIWGLQPLPANKMILSQMREEYADHLPSIRP
ncbi:MAG: glycogen/starch/alpha-glucan family phosphorylase [Verrucomicrobia bacterium]|nr:glycogen/starch/alpha-glucan family phosphorylase [Verrucomicrobiota bacterium]